MASGRKFHILVVDVGEGMAGLTVQVLERLGYSAQGEKDSLAALRTFSQDPDKFDLAIIRTRHARAKRPRTCRPRKYA